MFCKSNKHDFIQVSSTESLSSQLAWINFIIVHLKDAELELRIVNESKEDFRMKKGDYIANRDEKETGFRKRINGKRKSLS